MEKKDVVAHLKGACKVHTSLSLVEYTSTAMASTPRGDAVTQNTRGFMIEQLKVMFATLGTRGAAWQTH